MRLFSVRKFINRLLILGILMGIVFLIIIWKSDEDFLNQIREKIGVPIVEVVDNVAQDIVNGSGEKE